MAIVIAIFGAVLASGVKIYTLYKESQIIEQTDMSMLRANTAISSFREMYGRYPCPAKIDAVRGDLDYGYESIDAVTGDCVAVAGGVLLATSNNAALPNQDVFIGILPFRQLNLPEKLVSDGYKNRISYAVTGLLANDITYNNTSGGISIIDNNNNNTITPPDSAHFVIVSHNKKDGGAITQNGIVTNPCLGGTLDGENCDNDSTFRVGLMRNDFDDLVNYSVSDSIQQWQISNDNNQNIHLRRADNIAMGINETDNTTGFSEAEILDPVAGIPCVPSPGVPCEPAIIRASADPASGDNGQFFTSNICDESGVNCFASSVIAGWTPAKGMDCGTEYLTGIANGVPICENEITFSCPTGTFISGFDGSGKLVCDVQPPVKCSDENLTTSCGDTRNVTAFFYNGSWYGYAYSGQYYTIDPLDIPTITAAASIADVRTYIDTLNNTTRTSVDAGPTHSNAMVRDAFKCTAGNWVTTPVRKLERIYTNTDLSYFTALYNGWSWPAETGGTAYVPAAPMSVDVNNTDNHHDCWCREDYRVATGTCPAGTAGNTFTIQQQSCPQSGNSWSTVYNTDSSRFCVCAPGENTTTGSCKSYFGYSGNGVVGNVEYEHTTTCNAGVPTTTTTADLDECECPSMNTPVYTTDSCPTGTTNSFVYAGITYNDKSNVYTQDWICPTGAAPVKPIASSAEAGYYSARTLVHTQACVCDNALTKPYHENCLPGEQGTGKDYLLPWNCITGTFDAPSASNLVSDNCHSCIWQTGTKRSDGPHPTGGIVEKGTACPSCTGTQTCHEVVGIGPVYDVWDACYCAGQPN